MSKTELSIETEDKTVDVSVPAALLGQTMVNMITQEHGEEAAQNFVMLLIEPTLPGTANRRDQDAAWASLNRRLVAAVKTVAPAAEPTPTPSASMMTSAQLRDAA